MQGRNGDADVENGPGDTVGEGKNGTNGESSKNTYTPSGVKMDAGAPSLVLPDDLEEWDGG